MQNDIIIPASVSQQTPAPWTSDKYRFIPTTKFIEDFKSQGWEPINYREAAVRNEAKKGFQKHVVTFRNDRLITSDDFIPQIMLTNGHDGTTSFKLHAGIFRLVCSNGLVISDATFNATTIKHIGYNSDKIRGLAEEIVTDLPKSFEKVNAFRGRELSRGERVDFAREAAIIRWGKVNADRVKTDQILQTRRRDDEGDDLWRVFNTVQENVIRGGIKIAPIVKPNGKFGRRSTSRAIGSVENNLSINKKLWALAEELV